MMMRLNKIIHYHKIPRLVASRWDTTIQAFSSHSQGNETKGNRVKYEKALKRLECPDLYGLPTVNDTIRELTIMLKEGSLNLFPEYQRSFVWRPEKASRLVATVLCQRFIPPIVLHEQSKGHFDVVDGKQRLTSILGFFLGEDKSDLPVNIQEAFKGLEVLTKLDETYEDLNGLTFAMMSEDRQNTYKTYRIPYVKIPFNTPDDDVYEVYEDINSGGEDLKPQQIRRASHKGPYIKLLDDIVSENRDLQFILDPNKFQDGTYEKCKLESDCEMVLRAFAFRNMPYQRPLKIFLNNELKETQGIKYMSKSEVDKNRIQKKIDWKKKEFESVMTVSRNIFGSAAFRKWAPIKGEKGYHWGRDVSIPMWDAGYSAIAELLVDMEPVQFTQSKDAIVEGLKTSFVEGFFSNDSASTSDKLFRERKQEMKRIIREATAWRQIREAIGATSGHRDAKRIFPAAWRQPLYDQQGGICGICNQSMDKDRLSDGQYAQIDHIIPHSRGGKTIMGNAQLVHGDCNRDKGDGN